MTRAILSLLLVVTVVTAAPYRPGRPPHNYQEGAPCQTLLLCNDSVLLSQDYRQCDNTTCRGPNVCQETSVYKDYYESGVYACYGKYCTHMECVPTGVCNITVNETYNHYECCHGYTEEYGGGEDYHKYYYPVPGYNKIKERGCPRELNESICDCVESLRLTEFQRLLESTGLDDILCTNDTTQRYTVFAPTNEAITRASLGNLPTSELMRILRSHIVPKQIESRDMFGVFAEETIAPGHHIHVDNSYSWASRYNLVNGQRLLIEDGCKALTGVVHVIDGVINSTNNTIAQVLQNTPRFSTLWSILVRANLTHSLNDSKNFLTTFFAPDNAAFEKGNRDLGINIATCLTSASNATLRTILKYHSVYDLIYTKVMSQHPFLPTAACTKSHLKTEKRDIPPYFDCFLDIGSTDEGISVGKTGSIITMPDISASNGVVHGLSLPLIPQHIDLKQMCLNVKLN